MVADHYPALSFQTWQFLEVKTNDIIQVPFVIDIFTLDAMTEMLDSPLRFLDYVNRRTKYGDRLSASGRN